MAHSFLDIPQEYASVPGIRLFRDVFIRADKNGSSFAYTIRMLIRIDDGHISFQEFSNYFGDQVLSTDELKVIFDGIDKDHSGSIEVGELCEYFTTGFGPFAKLFATLEELNKQTFESLHQLAEVYPKGDKFEKFRNRFFVKEIGHLLHALHDPYTSTTEALLKEGASTYVVSHVDSGAALSLLERMCCLVQCRKGCDHDGN